MRPKKEHIEGLKREAEEGKIHLYFADEADLNLLPTITRCWTRKGKQRKIPTPGKNQKRYVAGAVNWVTGELEREISEHKDNVLFRALLRRLLKRHKPSDEHPKLQICVVIDNYSAHKAKKVKELEERYRDCLELVFLPTYSTHLNPIELLWKHLRRRVTHNHYFGTIQALLAAVQSFFDQVVTNPVELLSVIGSHA